MMSLFIVFAFILIVLLLIFFHFYYWCGIRVRRLISSIPGYTETESWAISYEAAVLPTEGVLSFLERVFGKYTSVCSVWFLGVPNVNLSSPGNLEALLKSVQHITKGREYFILVPWLGDGLLTSTGAKWHAHRKMLTPAFHFRILESCLPIFNRNAELLITILQDNFEDQKILNVDTFISLCSLDIISEAAMGVRLEAQLQKHSTLEYVNGVKRMGQLCLNRAKAFYLVKDWVYSLTPEGKEQKKLLNMLHSFTENVIKECKHKRMVGKETGTVDQQPTAFVDILLEMSENEPGLFTDVEIREEVDTFIFEGHDTTSASISWSLLLLGHDQTVQERAYNELCSIFGNSDRPVTKQDLTKMIYLEAVIKESLRLYPPVSYMSRTLDSDLKLEKHIIPAGSNVLVIPYFLHRQSQLYPDPEKFDPDRFLKLDTNRHPFMYIPFSGGPRNCIGQRFAMMEMKVIISHILRHFKVEAVTKREGLKLIFSPILKPMDGIYVTLYKRN
uniref:Cytochrome P450 n=1 Tax=Cuerna arida TaxID=1464854 RepID=A0A1B6F266_9HEMI